MSDIVKTKLKLNFEGEEKTGDLNFKLGTTTKIKFTDNLSSDFFMDFKEKDGSLKLGFSGKYTIEGDFSVESGLTYDFLKKSFNVGGKMELILNNNIAANVSILWDEKNGVKYAAGVTITL
jgi:hypothetical protein